MNIAILGTGAFGIALATVLVKNNNVKMWTKFETEKDEILAQRENKKLLPGIKIDDRIIVSNDLEEVIRTAKIIYLAVPMFALREVAEKISTIIKKEQILCITSKGVEESTGLFPEQVIKNVCNFENIAMISGPSFAKELSLGAHLGLTIACKNIKIANIVKSTLENENIMLEVTDDILGIQILATIKNIYAMLFGFLSQKNCFESTKACLLKSVINDCAKILNKLGGKKESIYSYAGIGDLLLTCISSKSRNFSFGKEFAKTYSINDSLKNMNTTTVEGLYSLRMIYNILKNKNINIDSINCIYDIFYNNEKVENVLKKLN